MKEPWILIIEQVVDDGGVIYFQPRAVATATSATIATLEERTVARVANVAVARGEKSERRMRRFWVDIYLQ
jgi:hypothetical protein